MTEDPGQDRGTALLDEGVLDLLGAGHLRLIGLMPRSSNYTFLAEATHEGRSTLAIYKPRGGETPLWDFPEGTLCLREVAAYVLSRKLGWPLIPPTALGTGPHGPGSVQLFIEAAPDEHYFTLRDRYGMDFRAVAAFDAIVNNADRKAGHCLLRDDGTVWLVDHGVCFGVEPKLRTVIWDFAGEPVPRELLSDISRVGRDLRSGTLRTEMLGLLSPREVDATASRAERLAATGRFPSPGRQRPYPWPPV